jgi:TonB family protein
MASATTYYREYVLPWTLSREEERRFRKILLAVVAAVLLLSIITPWLPVSQIERDPMEDIEPRFARLILEKKQPPPPPPVQPEPEVVKPESVAKESAPEPEPVKKPEPAPKPVQSAREKASKAGLLPFAEELAALRENQAVASITESRNLSGTVQASERTERSLITSNVGKASGGINTSGLSRSTGGGGGLAARSVTQVESPVGGEGVGAEAGSGGTGRDGSASRSREEIEMVFDRNKGAIYALYNRALRKDPTLQGKLVLRLTIDPSGAVTMCEVVSSELGDSDLERKLVQRIKMFRFEAKDVAPVTTTKPIDFFPA